MLAGYQIDDQSTLVQLLSAKLSYQEIAGDYAGGLKTVDELRALQTKPAAKALTGLLIAARLQAAIDVGASPARRSRPRSASTTPTPSPRCRGRW